MLAPRACQVQKHSSIKIHLEAKLWESYLSHVIVIYVLIIVLYVTLCVDLLHLFKQTLVWKNVGPVSTWLFWVDGGFLY